MSTEPDPRETAASDAAALKDRLEELRRALFAEQSRLKRRREDARRLGDLDARLQDEGLALPDRKSLETVRESLRRGLERSRLLDGSDEALGERTAQQAVALAALEKQWRDLKAGAAKAPALPGAAGAGRDPERVQRARRQKCLATLGMLERQVDALRSAAALPGIPATPTDETDLSDDALRARFLRLSERVGRLVSELRGSRCRTGIRIAALELELGHWNRSREAEPAADLEALSRHLRHELQRFVQLLDTHLAERLAQSLQYLDEATIHRFNQTDTESDVDPAFEQLSFRGSDLRLLSDLASALVEPLLQAQGRLLPARSVLAVSSFRDAAALSRALGAPLADVASRPELQVPAVPAALVSKMVQGAVQLGGVAPLSARSEVTPLRRLRRGDVFGAVGSLLVRAARYPARLVQPLGMLSLIGVVAMTDIKNTLQGQSRNVIAVAFVLLLFMTYRSWTKEARLAEIELLKKGKAMLREQVSRQLDGLRQDWKRLLTEHCERSIDQTVAALKGRLASPAGDELRLQRECRRIDSELRERKAEQRRLADASAQASRLAGEDIASLRAAIEADLPAALAPTP